MNRVKKTIRMCAALLLVCVMLTTTAFAAGDRVAHPTFGEGVILSTRPMAADTLLEVAFDRVGTKKLMATYAKLKKI